MSLVGKHYKTSNLQIWFRNIVPAVLQALQGFPNLNHYLAGTFQSYLTRRYASATNAFFRSSLPPPGQATPSTVSLKEVEDAINIFGIRNARQSLQTQLQSRLSNNDYDVSFGVALELLLGRRFSQLLGQSNVSMYPQLSSGKISDVLVNLNGNRVYIEAGNLFAGKAQKKIQEILEKGAAYLWRKLSSTCFLDIEIDTSELVFSRKGYVLAAKSLAKLKQEIDRMKLGDLAGLKGLIMLDEAITVSKNLTVYQNLRVQNHFPTNPSDFLSLIRQQSVVANWVQIANPGSFGQSNMILSVIGNAIPEMTIARAQGFLPSQAGFLERQSFAAHVVRQVRAQLNQLEPNQPNIVLVQGYNWTIFGLGEALIDFSPVKNECLQFLNQNQIGDLSGICVMGYNFNNMFYINNPNCSFSSRLTKADIAQLGLQWT